MKSVLENIQEIKSIVEKMQTKHQKDALFFVKEIEKSYAKMKENLDSLMLVLKYIQFDAEAQEREEDAESRSQ